MDPKRSEIPKIEFQSTEDRTKKIVAIMRMLKESNYSELRSLPDSELSMLFKVLIEEKVVLRRYSSQEPSPFGDYQDGINTPVRPVRNNVWAEEDDEVMPF